MITYKEDVAPKKFPFNVIPLEILDEHIYDDSLRQAVKRFINTWRPLWKDQGFPASRTQHQWWSGGWKDHVEQVIMLSLDLYESQFKRLLDGDPKVDQDRLICIALLHDAEKFDRYKKLPEGEVSYAELRRNGETYLVRKYWEYATKHKGTLQADLRSIQYAAQAGFPMEDWLLNGITFAEGGWSFFKEKQEQLSLSTIVSIADGISAQLYFNVGNSYGH